MMPPTRAGRLALAALVILHAVVLGADVLAPYSPDEQAREFAYAPPTRVRFVDAEGHFHLRPFVLGLTPAMDDSGRAMYAEDPGAVFPLRLFIGREAENRGGWRLFGVDRPMRVMLFGADAFGRDQFSRFVYGGRISLFAGLVATVLAVAIGLLVGLIAGAGGARVDWLATFAADLTLSLPWVYLLLGVRAALPLSLAPQVAFFTVAGLVGLVGWGRLARLVRATVLAVMRLDFVSSARASGISTVRLIRAHLLPHAWPVAAAQASLLLPQFVLAEIALSFFGLGVGEPTPSWGALLSVLQQYGVITRAWWLTLPAIALVPVFLLYYVLARDTVGSVVSS